MVYFNYKDRTFSQIFYIFFGVLGTIGMICSILFTGIREFSQIGGLAIFLVCIWSGTIPNNEKEKEESFDDILDY